MCLLKCHNYSNWIYQKMSIERKRCLLTENVSILNENVSID